MKFEIGKFYRTAGGNKYKLIHAFSDGALIFADDDMHYTTNSQGHVTYPESSLNIVSEWSDKRRVSITIEVEVDEKAKYVAVDRDGEICAYRIKAEFSEGEWVADGSYIQRNLPIVNASDTLTEVK